MFNRFFKAILDTIYPPRCAACMTLLRQRDTFIPFCEPCARELQLISSPLCSICGIPFEGAGIDHPCPECIDKKTPFSWHRSWAFYEGPLRTAIIRFKFQKRIEIGRDLAIPLLSCTRQIPDPFPDIVTPVPLHNSRLRQRGYNQAKILVEHLHLNGVKKLYNLISKVIETPDQIGLSGSERMNNLKNAFVVDKKVDLKGKTILIVDDVYTTGTTMRACARVLKKAGAAGVYGISLTMPRP